MIGQEFRGPDGGGEPGRRRAAPFPARAPPPLGHPVSSRPGWLRQPPARWRGQDGAQPGALSRLSSPDGPGPASPFGGPARPGCAGGSGGRARRLPGRSGRPRGWPSARRGSPFLITEFAALWAAQLLSSAGDQLVQFAVAAGVYRQTGSPLLAALAYAVSYAALLTGGPLLAEVAGLTARRSLLITLAAGRAVLAGLLATAGLPLAGDCALLVTALLLGGSFTAARAAELPGVLPAGRLAAGIAASGVSGRAGPGAGLPGRRDPAGHGRSRRGSAS